MGAKENTKVKDLVKPFHVGVAFGARYEIQQSGFFLGGHYEMFPFADNLKDNETAKAWKQEKNITKKLAIQSLKVWTLLDMILLAYLHSI